MVKNLKIIQWTLDIRTLGHWTFVPLLQMDAKKRHPQL